MLRDDETKQYTPQDPKSVLLRVELNAICSEFSESLLKIGYDLVRPFGLDHDVIHVGLNGSPDEVSKTLEHTSLVCSSYVFQTERHHDITERPEQGDERSRELVRLFHGDLMVPAVCIKEAEGFTP